MNDELQLQAFLDGELSGAEARQIRERLDRDAAFRSLAEELTATRQLLAKDELSRPCPASREFYWSQIQRRIRAETPRQPSPAARGLLGWIREHLLVSGGLATATAVLAAVLILPQMKGPAPDPHFAAIMESPAEGVHGIYFRSEAEGATLVWLSSMP